MLLFYIIALYKVNFNSFALKFTIAENKPLTVKHKAKRRILLGSVLIAERHIRIRNAF